MKKLKLNHDIKKSITKSAGRFVSIMLLMALGSFALVGLFVTGPDMRESATRYFQDYNTADLSATSDYGIDTTEINALKKDEGVKEIEPIYMKDAVIEGTDKAFRIASMPESLSQYELKEGEFPKKSNEIAIDNYYNGQYKIGDEIEFSEKSGGVIAEVLKVHKFKIVGFCLSSEIVSNVNRGMTTVGTGSLEGYGVVTKDAFDSPVYMMVKMTFNDTANLDPFSADYISALASQKEKVNDILKNQEQERLKEIKVYYQKEIDKGKQKIQDAKEELENAKSQLDDAKMQIDSGQAQIDSGKAQIESAKEEIKKGEDELKEAKVLLQEAIESGLVPQYIIDQMKDEIAKGEAKLEAGKSELKSKEAELESGKAKLEESKAQYEHGLAEYKANEPAAQKRINDGEREIQKQQAKLDELKKPTYSVFTRRELPGAEGLKTYSAISDIIDSLANVFPIFLYFVAALVALTTMTRFVSEERQNAGTLKALGYRDRDIIKKFIVYGLITGLTGTAIGVTLGHTLMPYIAYSTYKIGFTLYPITIRFYLSYTVASILLSLISTILPTYIVAHRELRETPASLLLPKAPKPGTKILLEKIGSVWSRMSFTLKVTARNIFRYKSRMWMTIIGAAGATAVLFTGLAVQGSVADIKDRQFLEILKYDMIVAQNQDLDSQEKAELLALLKSDEVKASKGAYFEESSITGGSKNDKQPIKVVVPASEENFQDYIDLLDAKTGERLSIEDGPVVSQRLADQLQAGVGQTLKIQDSENNDREIKVAGICEMYAGHFIFMNKADYEKYFDKKFENNAQLVLLKNDTPENTRTMANKFVSLSAVKTVSQNTVVYGQMETIVNALDKIMLILVLIASMLAVVIIYNLTNINVMERIRELSTIKVLGFRDKEVTMYIYRETISLSAIAIAFGCLIGMLIHGYILRTMPSDEVMFRDQQLFTTFLIPCIVICIVTFLTGLYVHRKLKNIDMLEALKSVD